MEEYPGPAGDVDLAPVAAVPPAAADKKLSDKEEKKRQKEEQKLLEKERKEAEKRAKEQEKRRKEEEKALLKHSDTPPANTTPSKSRQQQQPATRPSGRNMQKARVFLLDGTKNTYEVDVSLGCGLG